jgi:ubiquinone/menaquinone biosynthesis C-methylase UbiE
MIILLTSWLWVPLIILTSPAWALGLFLVYSCLKFFGFWGRVLWIQYEMYEWLMFRSDKPRRYLWKKFYNFIYWLEPSEDLQMINYGYASYSESGNTLNLPLEMKAEQFSYQLYDYLYSTLASQGKEKTVLDLGCGRGAGLMYIHRNYSSKKSIGIDFSSQNIRFCKKYSKMNNLEFFLADAEKLPLEDQSVDVVLCVESSHCFGNFKAVLTEVRRVLRNKGVFLLADFVGNGDLKEYEAEFKDFLEIVDRKDISENVLNALKLDSERRIALIEKKVPFLLRRIMFRVSGVEGSSIYNQLEAGDALYLAYYFVKSD